MSKFNLPDIVVANLHRRFTGVSKTVRDLVPLQQEIEPVAVLDKGQLGLPGQVSIWTILRYGWTQPNTGRYRIFHARRDIDILLGLFLKYVLFQRWKLVFTSAAPKRHSRVLRVLMNRVDAIIATSKRSAQFLDWHTAIVGHGIDTDIYMPADREDAKRTLGLDGYRVIGKFGRIRHSKGTDCLVQALCEVLPDFPEWVCVITGDALPKHSNYLKDQMDCLAQKGLTDRVRFVGHVSNGDILTYYQACDLYVAASRVEGFGLTPMEAMACGVPVLTSHAGIWPELVRSQTGKLFETGNSSDLAAKLREMLSDPQKLAVMGQAGRKDILANHSIRNEVEQIHAVYATLR